MKLFRFKSIAFASVFAVVLFGAADVQASTIRTEAGLQANTLARNDDGSTGLVNIGFSINFFGNIRSQVFVNNNGNITFDEVLGIFTPFDLNSTSREIIAPFFADVDTNGSNSSEVTYGTGTVNGRSAFAANYLDVSHFFQGSALNSFQVVLIERSDTGAGNFDIEFDYDQIQWETGDASSGSNGLGGDSARVGYSNGSGSSLELLGSAVNGAFLDGGPNALISNSNVGIDGRYVFQARNGQVIEPPSPPAVPLPAGLPLLVVGLGGLAVIRSRKRQ